MRATAGCILVVATALGVAAAQSQTAAPRNAAVPAPNAGAANCPGHPDALGLARIVEVDTKGADGVAPGFGFPQFKMYDFLRTKEIVLTFDDGPWEPGNNTVNVLEALAANCIKATFFPIGKHATYYPQILKQVAEAGHSIGSHTWSHKDLSKASLDEAKLEIEKGISAVHMAVGGPTAPFFRFPALAMPPEAMKYLAERNIAIFSADIDSRDFVIRKPELVVKSVMTKLEKQGKGIILMHDFQHGTSQALPELLRQLKAGGYKVVQMVAKTPVQTLPQYDEELKKENPAGVAARPMTSVIRTISDMEH
jgi:peptidoglycan/xylan/chitin deacetylase (PgdA/CDA1 family)